jgi:hypothetical protein
MNLSTCLMPCFGHVPARLGGGGADRGDAEPVGADDAEHDEEDAERLLVMLLLGNTALTISCTMGNSLLGFVIPARHAARGSFHLIFSTSLLVSWVEGICRVPAGAP